MSGAVVTGAGRGLGRALAHLLAGRGFVVHVTDVDGAAADEVAEELGGDAFASTLDVRDERACAAAAAATVDRAGSLAVWVNNAGVLHTGPAWEQTSGTHRAMLEVNALGTINGTLAAIAAMRGHGGGHVLTIVSLAGLIATPGEAVYSASKHAAIAFSLSTLSDLRQAGVKDIAISCLCPDGIWTPMLHDKLADPTAAMSFSGKLLTTDEVVAAAAAVLDRPRPVTMVPPSRGLQARLLDLSPGFAVRLAPLIGAEARRRQRRHARRFARGDRAQPNHSRRWSRS